jgi:phosphate transport system protein
MSQRNVSEALAQPTSLRRGLVALDEIWSEVLQLAAAVERMFREAAEALCEGRAELAAAVKAQERSIDGWEVRIEKECLLALALHEPLATDLRRIVSVLKLRADLECVSNLATKIARRSARSCRGEPAPPIPASLEVLARMAADAFGEVVAALGKGDAIAARAAFVGDEKIHRQYKIVSSELADSLRGHPEQVTPLLRLMNSARNLKRISEHTVKIAEAILYIKG